MNNVYLPAIPPQMINNTPVLLITYRRSKNIPNINKLISTGFDIYILNCWRVQKDKAAVENTREIILVYNEIKKNKYKFF